jgi:hypothetical protein
LSRIEKWAFRENGLVEIIILASVEALGELCFSLRRSLSSVALESVSRLREVSLNAFWDVIVHFMIVVRFFGVSAISYVIAISCATVTFERLRRSAR